MPSEFNPFSGLGKIESYIRWNRMRNISYSKVLSKSLNKFGKEFRNVINAKISETRLKERAAQALRQSGATRQISDVTLPLGKNSSNILRVTARVSNSKFKTFGTSVSSTREITMDVPRKGTKRQLAISLRERILDAFFEHYEINNRYRPDFRKKFGDVDIVELEGV